MPGHFLENCLEYVPPHQDAGNTGLKFYYVEQRKSTPSESPQGPKRENLLYRATYITLLFILNMNYGLGISFL